MWLVANIAKQVPCKYAVFKEDYKGFTALYNVFVMAGLPWDVPHTGMEKC